MGSVRRREDKDKEKKEKDKENENVENMDKEKEDKDKERWGSSIYQPIKRWRTRIKKTEDKDEKRKTVMMEMRAVKKKWGSSSDMEWVDLRRSDQMKELIIELPRPWWQAKEISVDDQTLFWEDEEQDYNSGTEKQNQQKTKQENFSFIYICVKESTISI